MHRTLRFQLIAIVLVSVTAVLVVSQWIDTTLSERVLERDLKEHALLALSTVHSLWEHNEPDTLGPTLTALLRGNSDIVAVDIFRLDGTASKLTFTTRSQDRPPPALEPEQTKRLVGEEPMALRVPRSGGTPVWRVVAPLRRAGELEGAAQVDVSLAEIARLQRHLRTIDRVLLCFSTAFLSLALAYFLERRVTRPVAALVDGMRRAESGARGVRVSISGGGEFGFLAGSFNRMLGRLEDLTAGLEARVREATRKLAEKNQELEEANGKLWQAQLEVGRSERLATLGQMAATIAHELGTPLNSILGYTQLLLQREDLPPEQAARLAIVESQVQRMIETIRGVLDRTRERRRDALALRPLVAEALALVSTRLAGRDLVAQNEVPADLPLVPGDGTALRQVLLNLLTNAIDATEPPGTIRVTGVPLAADGHGGAQIEIAVRDSGHGMTPEEAGRAFEPFYTTKAPGRGTGLGLAIVDHIIRAHGGRVLVESAPRYGTTVRVQLPLEP
jgi:signal transduction histidine kinase